MKNLVVLGLALILVIFVVGCSHTESTHDIEEQESSSYDRNDKLGISLTLGANRKAGGMERI